MDLREHDAPPFRAIAATGVGYGLLLIGTFVLLFALPYLLFVFL